jgi:hypothetical protein
VRLQVTSCSDDLADRLPSLVKLEIDVLLRERGPTRSAPESITVRCEGEMAQIKVTQDGANRAGAIDLHALAAEHRARAVALATAELVHAMATEPRTAETRPTPVVPLPAARIEPDRSAPETLPGHSSVGPTLLVGGLAEWRGNPAALLFGGRAAFQYALGKVVTPEVSVDASFGGKDATSAHVAIQSASAGAHIYFGTTTGSLRWEVGPGARFGWVHLAGQPQAGSGLQGSALSAGWGGPEARARIAYRPVPLQPALFALQIGAGVVALPVRGLLDGVEPVYAVEGPWMSVGAELGLGL